MEISPTMSSLVDRMKAERGLSHCLVVLRGLDVGNVIRLEGDEVVVGRDPDNSIILTDEGVSRRHARFMRDGKVYRIEDLGSTNGVFVNGSQASRVALVDGDKILLGRFTVLKYAQQDELELEYQMRIHRSASLDGLTGALNRRSIENQLASEVSFARRHGTELSVLMLDIDHFKKINDTYGHTTGDEVLRGLAQQVKTCIRIEDLFGRWGGEEFVVLVRGVGRTGSFLLANRLLKAIEQFEISCSGERIPVTTSIGVATLHHTTEDTAGELIVRADQCLYEAKRQGRNRVVDTP
jgi:diguanylate cyclase (GGDEF)-like protein